MEIRAANFGRLSKVADGNVGRPLLSADGKTVVYTRWNGSDWDIERHRDGKIEAVSKDPRHDLSPTVSRNGDVVVFSRLDPGTGNSDLYRWENGQETPLATSAANETYPRLSPDGSTVVYVYDDPNNRTGFDIHRCVDGRCEEVTDGWPVDIEPFQSDDGSRIFFRRKVEFDGGDLWMRDERGTVKQLTFNPTDEFTPTVSGDGNLLAWSQERDGDRDLLLYNLSNGQKEVVGERGVNERDPALSKDGSILAFSRGGDIVIRENGQLTQLTQDGENGWPALSADGKVISWVGADPENSGQRAILKLERE